MLGYDISWAGFNTIEVMSSGKFTYKRIGYLAASQSFHMDTEVRFLKNATFHRFQKAPWFINRHFFSFVTAADAHHKYDSQGLEQPKSV